MSSPEGITRIPLTLHPRVFAALGEDLVTNDVVAIVEIVKNSYDALAENVWVELPDESAGDPCIVVKDDGSGMGRELIETAWAVVATPFRKDNPIAVSDSKQRRVSGEKGLGRLSIARLGRSARILTKVLGEPCWEITIDWSEVASAVSLADCAFSLGEYRGECPFAATGTLVQVRDLRAVWTAEMVQDLEENLARMVPPFEGLEDFHIHLGRQGDDLANAVHVSTPEFLRHPKYLLVGRADGRGNLSCTYTRQSIGGGDTRSVDLRMTWEQVYAAAKSARADRGLSQQLAHCGEFSFELRVWDIGADDTEEIAQNFDIQKRQVRRAIAAHKGVSVYRDGILTIPKSDTARDWLGLDPRRISKVGERVSTSQIVGYVSISADRNPGITDTSDRERLAETREVAEFKAILLAAVGLLESERAADRPSTGVETLEDIFGRLNADNLVAEVSELAAEGATGKQIVPLVKAFSVGLNTERESIKRRFVYYSRMATIGTIAMMLIHEIRNRTTALGAFFKGAAQALDPMPQDLAEDCVLADQGLRSLESLADRFAPLASRKFKRGSRDAHLSDRIAACLALQKEEIRRLGVRVVLPRDGDVVIAADPGEVDAVLLNLISNAVYWLSQVDKTRRVIEFEVRMGPGPGRAAVAVHDSGPGIRDEDVDRILAPGVTHKPGGIGMGLTVAAEIVAEYSGHLAVQHPGALGGGSFVFDLPVKEGRAS